MSEKKAILKEVFYFSGSKYVNQVGKVLSSLLVARMLGPQLKGIWAALSLILIYGVYAQCGTMIAMVRQVPLYRSRNQKDKAARVHDTVFTFNVFAALLLSAGIFGASFFVGGGETEGLYKTGLYFMAALFFLNHMHLFVTDFFRSEKRFVELSKYSILFESSASILMVLLVYLLRLNGMYMAKILAAVAALAIFFPRIGKRMTLRIHRRELGELMILGIPLLGIAFAFLLFFTVDRIMILKFLGEKSLGYYSIAVLLANTILFVPYSISSVFYPRLVEAYGSEAKDQTLWRYIRVPGEMIAAGVVLLIGFFLIAAPWGVNLILPAFYPGVKASLFLMGGTFFYATALIPANFLVTTRQLKRYLAVVLACLALSVFLNYLFITFGWGLWGIGLATSISYVFFSLILLTHVSGFFLDKFRDRVFFIGRLYSPLLLLLAAGAVSFCVCAAAGLEFQDLKSTKAMLIKLFFFSCFSLPLVFFLKKRTGISFQSLIPYLSKSGGEAVHEPDQSA